MGIFPEFRLTRALAHTAVAILLLAFLTSYFIWAQYLYVRIPIFSQPALRILKLGDDQNIDFGREWLMRRTAVVENRGHQPASHVFVNATVPRGRITRYEVISDTPYQVHADSWLDQGQLTLFLNNLAPGAQVYLHLWAAQPAGIEEPAVKFRAVSDTGAAEVTTGVKKAETALEEIKTITDRIVDSFRETWRLISKSDKVQQLARTSGLVVAGRFLQAVPMYIWITLAVVAAAGWLFLDRLTGALLLGTLAGFLSWILFDEQVAAQPLIWPMVVAAFALMVLIEIYDASRGRPWSRAGPLAFITLLVVIVTLLIDESHMMSLGVLIGYGVSVLWLLLS